MDIEIGACFDAKAIGGQTMIGVGREERPQEHGNCFSVTPEPFTREELLSGRLQEFRIVNFNVENLEALFKIGLEYPIKCKLISQRQAIIHDPRIGGRWYSKRYCEVCCPKHLLPVNQIDAIEREIMRGDRVEYEKFTQLYIGNENIQFP